MTLILWLRITFKRLSISVVLSGVQVCEPIASETCLEDIMIQRCYVMAGNQLAEVSDLTFLSLVSNDYEPELMFLHCKRWKADAFFIYVYGIVY